VVGRLLSKIYREHSYAWHYASFNEHLTAKFGKTARGKQLKAYAEMVDDALERAVQLGLATDLTEATLASRLPTEGHLRALRQYHGRETTVSMLAQAIVEGTSLPHPQNHQDSAALPPPPPAEPPRGQLKRLSRDALTSGLDAFTNVDPFISRAMVLNIDRGQTLALIDEAIQTLETIRDQLLEHGGGR
jgi:hypothetical protein